MGIESGDRETQEAKAPVLQNSAATDAKRSGGRLRENFRAGRRRVRVNALSIRFVRVVRKCKQV